MKLLRIMALVVAAALLGTMALAQEPSLGEMARQQRRQKRTSRPKVITNDDLPSSATTASTSSTSAAGEEPAQPTESADSSKPVSSEDSEQQEPASEPTKDRSGDFRRQIEEQKKNVSSLEHEIDLIQREMNVDAAVYYADAGTRLRNDRQWTEKRIKSQEELQNKQKELSEAKDKLDEIREEARTAGVSASALE